MGKVLREAGKDWGKVAVAPAPMTAARAGPPPRRPQGPLGARDAELRAMHARAKLAQVDEDGTDTDDRATTPGASRPVTPGSALGSDGLDEGDASESLGPDGLGDADPVVESLAAGDDDVSRLDDGSVARDAASDDDASLLSRQLAAAADDVSALSK